MQSSELLSVSPCVSRIAHNLSTEVKVWEVTGTCQPRLLQFLTYYGRIFTFSRHSEEPKIFEDGCAATTTALLAFDKWRIVSPNSPERFLVLFVSYLHAFLQVHKLNKWCL